MKDFFRKAISAGTSVVLAMGLCPALAFAQSGKSPNLSAGEVTTSLIETQATTTLAPSSTSNLWGHDYANNWADCPTSYLHVVDSSLERVEFSDGKLIVETISPDFKSVSKQQAIAASTYNPSNLVAGSSCLWGGFYSGSTFNYVVTGQENDAQSDNLVVFRVTKYTKSWSYVAAAELRGANTTSPFSAGSCDMVESNGKLYVRSCHKMYTNASDGLRHQANVHIVINEATMGIDGSFTGVWNIDNEGGYVSHSFNQHLTALSGNVYGLDHGDAYPRAAVIKKIGGGNTSVATFSGNVGDNYTGAMIGGFESSATSGKLLSAGSWTYDKSLNRSSAQSNIWLGVTSSDLTTSSLRYATSYNASSTVTVGNPFLVKVNENRFALIWPERLFSTSDKTTGGYTDTIRYQFVDGSGNPLGGIYSVQGTLSDCQPVLFQGEIVWYAGDGGQPSFYRIGATSGAFSKTESLSSASMHYEGEEYQWYDWRTGNYEAAIPYYKAKTCPTTTLTLGGRKLVEGTDYTLSYKVDRAQAKGIITATGKGTYVGTSKSISFDIIPIKLQSYNVSLAKSAYAYTGKAIKPGVKIVSYYDGETLKAGTDFTVSYQNNKNIGTGKVIVKAEGVYEGIVTVSFDITKASNPLKVTGKTVSVKRATVKKKAVSVNAAKAYQFTKAGVGTVTYQRIASGSSKYLKVNAKTGVITVKKGTKPGTYDVRVKVKAAGSKYYKAVSKAVTVKVRVR